MKHTELREVWTSRLADFNQSEESIPEWCSRNNLKSHQLRYWIRKFETTEIAAPTSTEWYSVDIDQQPAESNAAVVVKVGTINVEVKSGFNPQLLIDVIRTLTSIC
ncbi:hypothetical protein ACFSFY_14375 [Sporosarcina siberiensis]|uniref:Transposase n=1 Tax=Sporosarcina siberiensis TaxID=1365606 RepID=A0ABW4SI88_9BACL